MLHLRPRIVAAASIPRLFASAFVVAVCMSMSVAAPAVDSATPPQKQNRQFGFAAGGNLHNLSANDLARYLDGVRDAHAGWVRFDVNWNVIQYRGPSEYNWEPFDRVVRGITTRGMRVLAGILYTPPWARASGTSSHSPPTNLRDYAAFVKTVVRRYAPMGVHAYEIWNEPNIASFWGPSPDPVRYTELLKLAYAAIKGLDPSATVVSAGLSPHGWYGEHDAQRMNPLTFLQRMYAAGAAGSFDALGWHPFAYPWGSAYAGWSAWSQMARTKPSARSIMRSHGDAKKRIWATEFGYPTGSSSRSVSETRQARLLEQAYATLTKRSWAGPAFVYSFQDIGTDKGEVEQNFGVVRFDFSAKPAYRAFQRAAAAG